jgi:hypothetical protein
MRFGPVVLAAVLSFGAGSAGLAQTLAQINGPKELPPADFTGQQFVDSRGCVFLRAGVGGAVTWVPRVRNDRKVLCGYPPTFAAAPAEQAAPAAVAAARPEGATPGCPDRAPFGTSATQPDGRTVLRCSANRPADPAPAPVVASAPEAAAPAAAAPARSPERVARSAAPARQAPSAPAATAAAAAPIKIGCPVSFPKPRRFTFKEGGTVVLCTRADGSLAEARAPIYPPGADVGLPLRAPTAVADLPRGRVAAPAEATLSARAAPAVTAPPKGYRLAWGDDRLNPRRGVGTAEGQAAQDRVWTRDVPAELVADQPAARKGKGVTLSTRAAPGPQLYVQVGTFARPENVAGSVRQLQRLGLPVAKARTSRSGQPLQVVLAGPFATPAEAEAAVRKARGAGFADAFLR